MNTLEVFVPVRPRPKGSWAPVTVQTAVGPRTRLVPDNRRSKPWARAVAYKARAKMIGPAWTSPVAIKITFLFRRPKTHFTRKGSLTAAGRKLSFPVGHRNYPDLDKLERNVWDALTGIVFVDDVQIVESRARKDWGQEEGALIVVAQL